VGRVTTTACRAVIERVKAGIARPFAGRKLPGWVGIALGVAERWALQEERIRSTFDLVRDVGGEPAMLVSVLESPLFSVGLIAGGVGYLIFAGEPSPGAVRHPWWTIVGWSVVTVCIAAVLLVFGYGYFQLRVMEVAGPKIDQIQKEALGGRLVWHMNDFDKYLFGLALDAIAENDRFVVKVWCSQDVNSKSYADDFLKVILDHKWPKPSVNCLFNNMKADLFGLHIAINEPPGTDITTIEIPKDAKKAASLLTQANLRFSWLSNETIGKDDYYIGIGIGPAP